MVVHIFIISLILLVSHVKSHEAETLQTPSVEDYCKGFTCIRKCCPEGMIINITSCDVPADESKFWKPAFHNSATLTPGATRPTNLKFLYGVMQCDAFPLQPYLNPDDKYYLLDNGSIYIPLFKTSYNADYYCIDEFSTSINETEEMALLCFEEPEEKLSSVCTVAKTFIYPILLVVSCIFLILTLAVYMCIPELRGKLHGRCLVSMISSMLVAYIFMLIVYFGSNNMSASACLFCASAKHISLLASFFWLNIMGFDIWRSLRSMRPASETSDKSRRRFALYSLYAWGSSFFIGMVAIVINNLPDSYENITRPNFGNSWNYCWFDSNKSLWLYFYMIILFLIIANILFFLHVAYIILKSQNNQRLQTARSQNRDRMWLYGKLFLVMGITWITEVISWKQGTCEAWIFTDIINALQGVIIFLVFVCKKTTRQLVVRRASKFKSFKSSRGTATSSTGKRSSTIFTQLTTRTSFSENTESSSVSNSRESRRLTEAAPSTRDHQMAVISETERENQDEGTEPNDQSYPAEVDEDCPSVHRDSDVSDSDESQEERISSRAEENAVGGEEVTPGVGPIHSHHHVANSETESDSKDNSQTVESETSPPTQETEIS